MRHPIAPAAPDRTRRRRATALLVAAALACAALAPVVGGAPVAVAASVSGIVNTYQAVSAVSGSTVTVTGSPRGAAAPFAVGDRVMLIQMTGVSPAQPGSNMGNYDTAVITAVSGSTITLSAITRTYSPATEAVQLVRMEYDAGTTTVTGTITAAPWDGATGGVVALAGGSLVLGSDIDASATGFTNDHPPTGIVVPSLSSGAGSATGRGEAGGVTVEPDYLRSIPGGGGGGLGGGGGTTGVELLGTGGGRGAGGASGAHVGGFAAAGPPAPGSGGGIASGGWFIFGGADGGAGGGGGVIGGGGGGGSAASGGGGGTDGGGAGGDMRRHLGAGSTFRGVGAGGGGPLGVGNGGDGLPGGPTGTSPTDSAQEGSAGAGGGSYGGGGGASSNFAGGDDSAGGGGGGSWTGGGQGGAGGQLDSPGGPVSYPDGGDGNAPVAGALPDSAHYLNLGNPRLMMGGAGGRGSQDSGHSDGGAGGGVVFLDFQTIAGTGDVRSDGGEGASPAGGGAHSGSGGGAGGQMRIRAHSIDSPIVVAANGGLGGAPTANLYHSGVSGGGGGAGGIWVELLDVEPTCPADDAPNLTFQLAGGNGGPPVINPKNGILSGTGGDGGTGLGCISPLQVPELVFDKESDPVAGTAVKPGDVIEYAVTIENTGTAASTDGSVTDDMSDVLDTATMTATPTLTCAPVSSSCGEVVFTPGDTQFVWRSTPTAPMDAGATATVTYAVEIDADATGTVGNVLVEPDIAVEHPIIAWSKSNDAGEGVLVAPGDTVAYTITVTNTGTVDSAEFSAVDDLSDVLDNATLDEGSIQIVPAGLGAATYDPAAETLTWTGALAAGETVAVTYAVVVVDDAAGQLRNAFFDTTVVNPVSASLRWDKVDDTAEATLLSGAEWELIPLDGEGEPAGTPIVIVDCVAVPCTGADTDPAGGQFLVAGLAPGDYHLVETRAPVGFVRDSAPIAVTVSGVTSLTVLDDIVNEQQTVPNLPFTGGVGLDHLLILGGILLALTFALGVWHLARRRRAS